MPTPGGPDLLFMTYLDQGHIGTLTDAAGVVWKYYYDADGKRRIKSKTVNGVSSISDNCSYYFYEGEDLICQQDVGALVQDESQYEPKFLLLDHLGSTRAELVFTESGGVFSPVTQEYYDLMPYGEIITPPTTQESVLFTGKSRDYDSGLDFFGARYSSYLLFRFLSVDPGQIHKGHITNPQKWNRYTYVINNPLLLVDITGNEEGVRINVFLNTSSALPAQTIDRVTVPPPNWARLRDVNVFGVDKIAPFAQSVDNANTTVYVGHSSVPTESVGRYVGQMLDFDDGQVNWMGMFMVTSEGDFNSGKPEVNGILALFTCNSKDSLSNDFQLGSSGALIVSTGGSDGLTNLGVLEHAAFAFVAALTDGNNLENAVAAAQRVIDQSATGIPGVSRPDPMQSEDRIEVIRKEK